MTSVETANPGYGLPGPQLGQDNMKGSDAWYTCRYTNFTVTMQTVTEAGDSTEAKFPDLDSVQRRCHPVAPFELLHQATITLGP